MVICDVMPCSEMPWIRINISEELSVGLTLMKPAGLCKVLVHVC